MFNSSYHSYSLRQQFAYWVDGLVMSKEHLVVMVVVIIFSYSRMKKKPSLTKQKKRNLKVGGRIQITILYKATSTTLTIIPEPPRQQISGAVSQAKPKPRVDTV